jgi:hypothetical protein
MASPDYSILIKMIRKDNPYLDCFTVSAMVARMIAHPGVQGSCVHQMPEGMSAFHNDVCVRCGISHSTTL